jgi:hypothetical protein
MASSIAESGSWKKLTIHTDGGCYGNPGPGGLEQDGAQLQRCIVTDTEPPIVGDVTSGIRQTPIHHGQEFGHSGFELPPAAN